MHDKWRNRICMPLKWRKTNERTSERASQRVSQRAREREREGKWKKTPNAMWQYVEIAPNCQCGTRWISLAFLYIQYCVVAALRCESECASDCMKRKKNRKHKQRDSGEIEMQREWKRMASVSCVYNIEIVGTSVCVCLVVSIGDTMTSIRFRHKYHFN